MKNKHLLNRRLFHVIALSCMVSFSFSCLNQLSDVASYDPNATSASDTNANSSTPGGSGPNAPGGLEWAYIQANIGTPVDTGSTGTYDGIGVDATPTTLDATGDMNFITNFGPTNYGIDVNGGGLDFHMFVDANNIVTFHTATAGGGTLITLIKDVSGSPVGYDSDADGIIDKDLTWAAFTGYTVNVTITNASSLVSESFTISLLRDGVLEYLSADTPNATVNTFVTKVFEDDNYDVNIVTNPANHTCTFSGGSSGTIAGANVSIAMTCVATDATLSALSISSGSLSPSFASNITAYSTTSVGFMTTTVTITATTNETNATLKVNGTTTTSGAGAPVALTVGWNTILVYVLAEDATTNKTTTLNIYRESAASFAQDAYIKNGTANMTTSPFTPGEDLVIGTSMAAYGDTMAVGVPSANTFTGEVFVFYRDASGDWVQEQVITAQSGETNDLFGYSVVLDQDTLIVGAPSEDEAGCTIINGTGAPPNANLNVESGAIFVYKRTAGYGTWAQSAYLKASNCDHDLGDGDRIGVSVAIHNNYIISGAPWDDSDLATSNADGYPDSILQDNTNIGGAGAAIVFKFDGTNWSQDAYLKARDAGDPVGLIGGIGSEAPTNTSDRFGWSVAIYNDTIAIGMPYEDSAQTLVDQTATIGDTADGKEDSGGVYIYRVAGNTWAKEAFIKATNPDFVAAQGDKFGWSVSLYGDTLVVGAPYEDDSGQGIGNETPDNGAINSGAVYVYKRTGTVWALQEYIKSSNSRAGDNFGYSVSLFGDSLVIGAPGEDGDQFNIRGSSAGQTYGGTANSSGATYMLTRSGTTWTQDYYLKASAGDANDQFGFNVFTTGNNTIVSTPYEDSNTTLIINTNNTADTNNTGTDTGATYIFR